MGAGCDADVCVRIAGPPFLDLGTAGGRVVDAVLCDWMFSRAFASLAFRAGALSVTYRVHRHNF